MSFRLQNAQGGVPGSSGGRRQGPLPTLHSPPLFLLLRAGGRQGCWNRIAARALLACRGEQVNTRQPRRETDVKAGLLRLAAGPFPNSTCSAGSGRGSFQASLTTPDPGLQGTIRWRRPRVTGAAPGGAAGAARGQDEQDPRVQVWTRVPGLSCGGQLLTHRVSGR